ncbi:MAG: hypothetical protein IPI67_39760 [Myxococcales bacterium]|nr:hypothetical protein [Myxococcales bacterium]
MGLRPSPARWFEVLTPSDELARTVEALAATGVVQLEAEADLALPKREPRQELDAFHTLLRRYSEHWPRPNFRLRPPRGPPDAVLANSLVALEAWQLAAQAVIEHKEQLAATRRELALLAELDATSDTALSDLAAVADAGPMLEGRLWVTASNGRLPELPHAMLRSTRTDDHVFMTVLAPRSELATVVLALEQCEAHRVELPEHISRQSLGLELARLDRELSDVDRELAELSRSHELAKHLANVHRLEWFLTHVPELGHTRHFALVTGWTSELDTPAMHRIFDAAGVHAMVRFPEPPSTPPVILRNLPWVKPFEAVAKLLGTPALYEADPSVVLVLLGPLLFGFMFADVGQGLVLILVGFALRRRFPALGMLIFGGLAAVVFGLLFGSVFGLEGIVPALWLHPLSSPLTVLAASVVLGALVLTAGFVLSAVEAVWRRNLGAWLVSDGTLALSYVALLASLLRREALWFAAASAICHVLVPALVAKRGRLRVMASAAAGLVERSLQLGVNTVSFARVGAFALAHAGLCLAIVDLSQAAGHYGGAVVLLLGNALVLVLEGLVVGIQTTRLVLFEFFVRFLQGEGRPFVPLHPPAPDGAMMGAEH